MIGARTVAALVVCAAACAFAAARGALDVGYLSALGASAGLLVGLFSSLAVVLVIGMWHPEGDSVFAIGLHRGRLVAGAAQRFGRRAIDLPRWGQQLLYLVAFAAIGLGSFGDASAGRLIGAWDAIGAPGAEYCRETVAAPVPVAPVVLPDRRGCALVRRAFELGYEKSLGNCAPPVDAADDDASAPTEAGPAAPPCTRRQRDEPFLHFNYRVLADRLGEARVAAGEFDPGAGFDRLRTQLDYVADLAAVTTHAVKASPRSAHHIFTNLPAPRASSFAGRFAPRRCDNPAAVAPPTLDWSGEQAASALFESAVGQLMLNRRYGPPVVPCGEVTIHWDAAADACDKMASDAAAALGSAGAYDRVAAVLSRRASRDRRRELAGKLGDDVGPPAPAPEFVVSLSCLIVGGDGTPSAAVGQSIATIDGAAIPVRSLTVPSIATKGAAQLDIYQHAAALLSGARYAGAVEDGAGPALRLGARLDADALSGDDFPFARLEALSDADPFLGDTWPLERGDLTEVYPFESHLRRVAFSFRRRYRRIRGRL